MRNDIEIQQVGLIFKDEQRLFHISPDGIMPDIEWGFETKNAKATIQYERLMIRTISYRVRDECHRLHGGMHLKFIHPVWTE